MPSRCFLRSGLLTGPTLIPAFADPLDAHFGAVRCTAFAENDWVKDPDGNPWLQLSSSPVYRPSVAGRSAEGVAGDSIGGTGEPVYVYVHLDEFVPDDASPLTAVPDPASYRTGYLVLTDKTTGATARLKSGSGRGGTYAFR